MLIKVLTVVGLFVTVTSKADSICSGLFERKWKELLTESHNLNISTTRNLKRFDEYPNFDYSKHSKILFLSDQDKSGGTLSEKINDPTKLIISSDISFNAGVNIRVDNQRLPFKKNSFDLIVMNRGLCVCKGTSSCGGIESNRASMRDFLLSAIEILDKNNTNSLMLMTGFYYSTFIKQVPPLWISVLNELKSFYPNLQFTIIHSLDIYRKLPYGFIGFAVSLDPIIPIEVTLQNLTGLEFNSGTVKDSL